VALVCLVLGALAGSYLVSPYLFGQPAAPPATPKELTSYRDVVKKVLPAVVSLEAKVKPKARVKQQPQLGQRRRLPDNMQIPEEFRRFFEELDQRRFEMPEETPHGGFGSGFVVDPKGVILTNYHVVDGADQVEVTLKDGRKFTSTKVFGDRKTDLAIVRIDTKGQDLPALQLGDSEAMEIGDRVLAVGAPFGLTGTVTSGIISAKGRNGLNMNMYEDFLQTDAAINPGNSGGPLVNLEGQVVGINAAIKTRTGGFQGIGLAVASNLAKNVMKSLERDGVVHRGYLGVQIKDLPEDVATQMGLDAKQGGVIVGQVFDDAPAAKAGIQAGDVITSLNGKPVKDGRVLQTTVAGLPLHKPVDVTVVRDGKPRALKVTIEEQPDEFGTARVPAPRNPSRGQESVGLAKIGVQVADLTADMAEELGYKKGTTGVVITQVESGSVAANAGLRRGTLISKVDRKAVATASAARQALEKVSLDKGVLLQVESPQGGVSYVVLKAETVK
jgi:serine protease Do